MNTVSRYFRLAAVSGALALLLLVAAVIMRIFALVSGLLVLLLFAATLYFLFKGLGLKGKREPPRTRAT
jgi:hypothetical protein